MLRHFTRTQTPSRQRFSRRHALTIVATTDCADRFCTVYMVRQNNVDSMFAWASPTLGPFVISGIISWAYGRVVKIVAVNTSKCKFL